MKPTRRIKRRKPSRPTRKVLPAEPFTVLGPGGTPRPAHGNFEGKQPSAAEQSSGVTVPPLPRSAPSRTNHVVEYAQPGYAQPGYFEPGPVSPPPEASATAETGDLASPRGPTGSNANAFPSTTGPNGPTGPGPTGQNVSSSGPAKSRPPTKRGGGARTAIGTAVLKNLVEIELIGASFIRLIDVRLESLQRERPNSGEACTARDEAIADYQDLRNRIEAFLRDASRFAAKKVEEEPVVKTGTSLAAGIGNWWSRRHVQICDKSFDIGLFGIGFSMCLLGGVDAKLAAAIPGAMVGGKPVVDVIKAALKGSRSKSK
jgi:hypothetical protein